MLAGQLWAETTFVIGNLRYKITEIGTYNTVSVEHLLTSFEGGDLVIPSEVTYPESEGVTYTVNDISPWAFFYCTRLTSVTIPNSIISIGEYAFSNCSGLISITIPESVTSIGGSAFNDCSSLETVNFNATNCTKMGDFQGVKIYPAFIGCPSLVTLNIGNNVNSIPNYAFYGCSSLKSVTIPNSVTSIKGDAFSYCDSIETLTYNTNAIGAHFGGKKLLTTLVIGDSVTSIDNYAFSNCSSLTSVTIPNSVKLFLIL